MQRYIIVRLAQAALTLVGVSIVVFALSTQVGNSLDYLPPRGDCDNGRYLLHITISTCVIDPWYVQYFTFVKDAAQGDFGPSRNWQGPAMGLVLQYYPQTLQLAAVSIGASLLLAVPIGALSAVRKGGVLDRVARLFTILGQSTPPFLVGVLLVGIFALRLEWLPGYGMGSVSHWILPVIALALFPAALLMRLTRVSMLEALDSNYVKTARIHGLPDWKVVWKHSLANAAAPLLATSGAIVASLLAGAVAVEVVFAWRGVGLLGLQAVNTHDYNVIWALIMFVSVLVIAAHLLIDILRAGIDPRIRHAPHPAIEPGPHPL